MKKALFFILISNLLFSQWSISSAERDALLYIYNTTGGEKWNRTWDTTTDPKNWFGVSVKNNSVTELNLSGNALQGTFPSTISTLSKLTKLDLSNNQLSGEVANGISSLSALKRLDVSNNRLTGDPSFAFSGLYNLEDLGIGGNTFIINDINGLLANFNNLKNLNIAGLGLSSVPSKITAFVNLENLTLDNNSLSANGFNSLSALSQLKSLSLSGNGLIQIPAQVLQLTGLTSLDLSHNNIPAEKLASLANLLNLQWLSLEGNQLTQIPSQLAQMRNLQTLNLGRNNISGNLSALTGLPKLQQLFLNNNNFSGNFPQELSAMPQLMMLNLNSNRLSGNLPSQLPEILLISNNHFTKEQLSTHLTYYPEKTELSYSPQRYDEEKQVLGILGQPAKLEQSLSGDQYSFTWYKNLDENTGYSGSGLHFNSVQQSDYATYTVEAYTSTVLGNAVRFDLSQFREPIRLVDQLGTTETSKYFSVYPNPAADYLYIISSKYEIQKIYIYDLSGKQIITDSGSKINVAKLPTGVYMLNIKTKDGIVNFKFIKK